MIDYTEFLALFAARHFMRGTILLSAQSAVVISVIEPASEKEGRCLFEDKHKEGYVFHREPEPGKSAPENDSARTKACPRCGNKNYTDALFCDKCGLPLAQNSSTPPPGYPFGGARGIIATVVLI